MLENDIDKNSREDNIIEKFESLGLVLQDEQKRKIREKIKEINNYIPKVGILGKTGAGKSSLCNAIFDKNIAKISDIAACTREPQRIFVSAAGGAGGIVLIDMPGVGENQDRDIEYIGLYKSLLPELDIILWVVKGDDRALSVDERVFKDHVEPYKKTTPIIFVVSQVDKIEPYREWDVTNKKPSPKQLDNIHKKVEYIGNLFNIKTDDICALSAEGKFGLYKLVERMVEVLPADKKVSIVREAKKENVSEKAKEEAARGFWDVIKEYIGKANDFYQKNKDTIHLMMAAVVKIFTKTRA